MSQDSNPPSGQAPQPASRWLSQDFSVLLDKLERDACPYDVVIVGSGYGGAVAAAEIAGWRDAQGRTLRVCVLERGREYLPGSFPSRFSELPGHVRFTAGRQPQPKGPGEALLDFRLGGDVSALVGNGLGGGSLINASVMAEPKFGTFDSGLPPAVEADLQRLYPEVKAMLGATVSGQGRARDNTIAEHPAHRAEPLNKRVALDRIAAHAGARAADAAITVEMTGGVNAQGVRLNACTLCGDCMTGCNVGARKSLDTNLLVQARQRGADIFVGVSVLQIGREQGAWQLELVHTDKGLREKYFHGRRVAAALLKAPTLILAAGTLGSTEILLRSQQGRFSARLGERFSCNGDNLAAVFGQDRPVESSADETEPLVPPAGARGRHVGPTITGSISMPPRAGQPGYLVQEFAVPAPLRRLFGELATTGSLLQDLATADRTAHEASRGGLDPLAVDPAAVRNTSVIGFIGHDRAAGRLSLPPRHRRSARSLDPTVPSPTGRPLEGRRLGAFEGTVRIRWKDSQNDPLVQQAYDRIAQAVSDGRLGRMVANPAWQPLPPAIQSVLSTGPIQGGLLTVHPLGGCAIGADAQHGVVDEHGVVFDAAPDGADAWQGSLLVLDGSILPGSLGANPALTIAALALRGVRHWRQVHGCQAPAGDDSPGGDVGPRPVYRLPQDCTASAIEPTQVQIVERLTGPVTLGRGASRRDCVVELTLDFDPVSLAALSGPMQRRLELGGSGTSCPARLRIYDKAQWDAGHLGALDEDERARCSIAEARLRGSMRLLDREPSSALGRIWRGVRAYLSNRGWRDIAQYKSGEGPGALTRAAQALRLASRAAELRRFDYTLEIVDVPRTTPGAPPLAPGQAIRGVKRFTYEEEGNPWNQLLYLALETFPGLEPGAPPLLKLDAGYLARRGVPLMRITSQQDQPTALAELFSFFAFFVRMLVSVHIWSLRAPDAQPVRPVQRLPGAVPGLPAPEIHTLAWTRSQDTPRRIRTSLRARLTRYRAKPGAPAVPPLLLIHGYSASGTTFAHPALDPGMARYFWERGRDVWILDLRTSSGHRSAVLPWTFEAVANSDIPIAIEFISKHVAAERGSPTDVQLDVVAHCIGAVMVSMALLTPSKAPRPAGAGAAPRPWRRAHYDMPGRIHRLVLSQKGFALAYTEANVLRAYVLRYLRPLLLPRGYRFQPPAHPGTADQLLDRLLASLPYPPEEFRRENPAQARALTPWTATRHRMDALYERTFSVNNVSDRVLEHIDDFFGPLHPDTVSQTIHFARHRNITRADGRNTFVNTRALARWPRGGTLSIHGSDNGMVGPYTLELMRSAMAKAAIPFETVLLPHRGHQDSLIGLNARETFDAVARFLDGPEAAQPEPQCADEIPLAPPWLGPRIHRLPTLDARVHQAQTARSADASAVKIQIGTHPARAESLVVVVPVRREADGLRAVPPVGGFGTQWVMPYAGWVTLDEPELAGELCHGYLVLVHHPYDTQSGPSVFATRSPRRPAPVLTSAQVEQQLAGLADDALRDSFVSRAALEAVRRHSAAELHLALASCQYPAGILDGAPACASLRHLAAEERLDAALMVGDQIYADATAGLLDPAREDDRYAASYEEWLRTAALRDVMRRMPVHMMLDDHEIRDNWEPGAGSLDADFDPNKPQAERDAGLRAFWRYQRGVVKPRLGASAHYAVQVGAFEVFMADTRSQRSREPGARQIMDSTQYQHLQDWLRTQTQADAQRAHPRPKFLACSVWLGPKRLGHPGLPEGGARADGWDGFPESEADLLASIYELGAHGVVALAGDAHLGCWCEMYVHKLHSGERPVRVLCVYAPAMYAPFPMANAVPQDFMQRGRFGFTAAQAEYACSFKAHWVPPGDGFVRLDATQEVDGRWRLGATGVTAAGRQRWFERWLS